MKSILDKFSSDSVNPDGGVTFVRNEESDCKSLYVTNKRGSKLLKIIVKSESAINECSRCAQVKIIPYGINRVLVWRDLPSDPFTLRLHNGVNLTYHGGLDGNKKPKVHIKASTGHTTLVDDSLILPDYMDHPVPIFSLEVGHGNERREGVPVTKSAHVFCAEASQPIRFDFFITSVNIDLRKFFASMYHFTLFGTLDYLAVTKGSPFDSGKIIAPIVFCTMGLYKIVVRRSYSSHNGRPQLIFYNNKSYYEKLMNRRVCYVGPEGELSWTTMLDKERELQG